MFKDGGRCGLLGTPQRYWARHATRPVGGARLERKYIHAFSAVCPHDGVMDRLVPPWVNAATMSLFLAEVAQRHPDEFIVMVMDALPHDRVQPLGPQGLHGVAVVVTQSDVFHVDRQAMAKQGRLMGSTLRADRHRRAR